MTGATTAAPVLAVRGLRVRLATPDGPLDVVRGVDLAVHAREVVGVVGESGSGKTTVALAVMGLLPAGATVDGSVQVLGREVLGDRAALRAVRGHDLAMVFQDPGGALNPVRRVGAQVAEAVSVHTRGRRRAVRARVVELLGLVGVDDPVLRARQFPHQLSGGLRQRVGIAMAVAHDPAVLVADEPTSALDVTVQAQVLDVVRRVQAATGTGVVLISHDLGVIAGVAQRVQVMYAGRMVESAAVDDLFARPRHPYTAGLLAARSDGDGSRPEPVDGAPPDPRRPPPGCAFHPRCPHAVERCRREVPGLVPVGAPGQAAACHLADQLDLRRVPRP